MINQKLKKYIKNSILPVYNTFDKGHGSHHIKGVIKRSLNYAKELNEPLNFNMVYVVAAYHDYGMKIERKNHNIHSSTLLKADQTLKQWFNGEQIDAMAEAVEDHSTSKGIEPRSIYGKIVSDADKDTNITVSLTRVLEFSFAHNPQFSKEEHFENCFSHMCLKYGDEPLVKFYLTTSNNKKYLKQIKKLTKNKILVFQKFEQIAKRITKKPL